MDIIRQTLLIALLSVFASLAQAKDLAHDVHLSLDASVLSWTKLSADFGGGSEDLDKSLQLGFPTAVGARIGFLPLEMLELGLRFRFDYTRHDSEGDKFSQSTHDISAYARYVAPGRAARLFVGPFLGGAFFKNKDPGEDGDEDFTYKGRMFAVGAELGMYGFLADSFSIDPFLAFTYTTGSFKDEDSFEAYELDVSGIEVTLNLALSGWISI
jgi:hypothetical protein